SVSSNAGGVAAVGMDIQQGCITLLDIAVIARRDTDKNAHVSPTPAFRRDTSVFQGFPGGFQQPALLGIHLPGFAGGDAKEMSIKLGRVGDETAPFADHPTGKLIVRMVEFSAVPAVGGNFTDAGTSIY